MEDQRHTATERNRVPSSFPRRREQMKKGKTKRTQHNNKGRQRENRRTENTTATEAANKANQTKLNNASKQRR